MSKELSELFNEFKGMDNYYGLHLLNDNYCSFYEFIQNSVVVVDFDDEIISDGEEENKYNTTIYGKF